jgi:hypothetical protein
LFSDGLQKDEFIGILNIERQIIRLSLEKHYKKECAVTKLSALIIALAAVLQAAPPSDTCNQNTWVTNGLVLVIVPAGDKVYIGGIFSRVGPYTGGVFDSIHSVIRNNIAALDATTGNALPWNPNAGYNSNQSACVYSFALSGTTIYAGGIFNTIGGQSRNNIAAVDVTTGNATAWNPNANGRIQSIAVSGTTVYAGGAFDTIGGQSRNNIAALDVTTGNATAWNPNAGDNVNALGMSGSTVYAVGGFTTIGGQSRNYIAALDVATGNATAWNPNADNPLYLLAVNGTTVYVGGCFASIGGQSRNYIAALDATTGNALAWNPNANSLNVWNRGVYSLVLNGTTVYAGGGFTTIGGQSRSGIAALDATTGNVLAWNPDAEGPYVSSLAASGSTVYVGGGFTSIGQGVGHPFFARFDSLHPTPVIRSNSPSSSVNNAGLQITNLYGSHCGVGALVKIAYALPNAEQVSLRLYSINGQMKSELVNKHQDAGNYSLNMQRGVLAAGAYLVVLSAGDYHQEKMISLMK